jgi:hypothetical protein
MMGQASDPHTIRHVPVDRRHQGGEKKRMPQWQEHKRLFVINQEKKVRGPVWHGKVVGCL